MLQQLKDNWKVEKSIILICLCNKELLFGAFEKLLQISKKNAGNAKEKNDKRDNS